jgi:septal ring factor EnvC (AmiA/AmiB activator)
MNSEGLKKKLEALREQRSGIDRAIEQLEAQIEAQERAEKRGAEIQEVEPARGGGSYVLQKVKCGKPSCRCARTGGELHGPYWYLFTKKDGKTRSKYVGKNRPAVA